MASNWSELSLDLLLQVLERIKDSREDFIAFSTVCHSWGSLAINQNNYKPTPRLLLPVSAIDNKSYNFLNLETGKILNYKDNILLPEAYGHGKLVGASQGWLMFVDYKKEISLLNPISRSKVSLPVDVVNSKYDKIENIDKVALSCSPTCRTSSDCQVMIIHGDPQRRLAFCRQGDNAWKEINILHSSCMDVIYYDRHYCAIDRLEKFYILDVSGPIPVLKKRIDLLSISPFEYYLKYYMDGDFPTLRRPYLVQASGELLMVLRRGRSEAMDNLYETYEFRVFAVDSSSDHGKCKEVNYLGNNAIFVGKSSSFSFEVEIGSRCEANCIYFTGDGLTKDTGAYSILERSINRKFMKAVCDDPNQPVLWIEPTFWIDKSS